MKFDLLAQINDTDTPNENLDVIRELIKYHSTHSNTSHTSIFDQMENEVDHPVIAHYVAKIVRGALINQWDDVADLRNFSSACQLLALALSSFANALEDTNPAHFTK